VRAGLAGTAVAALVAGPMEGVGFNVAGGAVATVLPLAILAALRVQRHADERTPAITVTIDPSATAAAPTSDGAAAPAEGVAAQPAGGDGAPAQPAGADPAGRAGQAEPGADPPGPGSPPAQRSPAETAQA
jgi:hypothetical protein